MARKHKKAWHGWVVWAVIVLFFLLCYFIGRIRG